MIGKIISHYTIIEKLGEGGMGVVYKAEDTKLSRMVALKFLPQDLGRDLEAKRRFIHEAKAASSLQHDNICTIHDIDETDDGQMFIVMDYYEGETLKEAVCRGQLAVGRVMDITMQITAGLQEAYDKGIVHRDIKPANIMITNKGEVKIMDFGLAKLADKTKLTKTGSTLGTAPYMSPEQTRGEKVDHRTDLWSLGVVIYEMLTGQLPFKGTYEQAVIYSILNETPEPPTSLRSGIPMDLERVVDKTLCKNVNERYQHADDLLADLQRIQRKEESGFREEKNAQAIQNKGSRTWRRSLIAIAAVLIMIVIMVGVRSIWMSGQLPRQPIPVAVIPFENQTGNPQYDYLMKAIPNLLITSLEQSKYLRVTTWERMRDLLRQLGKAEPQTIDRDLGFELCRMDGVRSIVLGSFTKAGDQFATDVKVLDVESKRILAGARANGDGEASILRNQIDELSKEISHGIGLAKEVQDEQPKPIAEVTTQSMQAYSYFLLGREKYDNMDIFDAIRILTRAVEEDSNFAIAWLYLGKAYGQRSNVKSQQSMIRRAYRLAGHVTKKEQMYIESSYANRIENDPNKSTRILESMRSRFPNEKQAHYELSLNYVLLKRPLDAINELDEALRLDPNHAPSINQLGYVYMGLNRYQEAINCLRKYVALIPNEPNPYDSMGDCHFRMGFIDSALVYYQEAVKHKPDFFQSAYKIGMIYFLQEEFEAGLKCFDEAMLRTGQQTGGALAFKAIILTLLGRYSEAKEQSERSVALWQSLGATVFNPIMDCFHCWSLHNSGKDQEAAMLSAQIMQRVKDLKGENRLRPRLYCLLLLGVIDIKQNRHESARTRISMIADSSTALESWAKLIAYENKRLEGNLLLAQGHIDSAILLLSGLSLPPQPNGYSTNMGWYNLTTYEVSFCDVLARAYLKKGDLASAAREYERLTTFNPKNLDLRFIHPLLHFRLGQVYESMGAKEKAVEQYKKFLNLWKKAEGNPPEVGQARERLQRLQKNG